MKRLSKAGRKESNAANQWSKFRLNKISFIYKKECIGSSSYKEKKKEIDLE